MLFFFYQLLAPLFCRITRCSYFKNNIKILFFSPMFFSSLVETSPQRYVFCFLKFLYTDFNVFTENCLGLVENVIIFVCIYAAHLSTPLVGSLLFKYRFSLLSFHLLYFFQTNITFNSFFFFFFPSNHYRKT